jgi:serine/threonine protein phosphatase PrpC
MHHRLFIHIISATIVIDICGIIGVLAISRALGDHLLKENDVVTGTTLCSSYHIMVLSPSLMYSYVNSIAEPYCQDIELTAEDQYLILACDGLWDVMTDQDACDLLLAKVKADADGTHTHLYYHSYSYSFHQVEPHDRVYE